MIDAGEVVGEVEQEERIAACVPFGPSARQSSPWSKTTTFDMLPRFF